MDTIDPVTLLITCICTLSRTIPLTTIAIWYSFFFFNFFFGDLCAEAKLPSSPFYSVFILLKILHFLVLLYHCIYNILNTTKTKITYSSTKCTKNTKKKKNYSRYQKYRFFFFFYAQAPIKAMRMAPSAIQEYAPSTVLSDACSNSSECRNSAPMSSTSEV